MLDLPTFQYSGWSDLSGLLCPIDNDNAAFDVESISSSPRSNPADRQHMSSNKRNVMAHAVAALHIGNPFRGEELHQRQGSGSTVASSVVDSPYNSPYCAPNQSLHIANPDNSPSTYYMPDEFASNGQFATDALTSFPLGYKPSTLSHTPIFPPAMNGNTNQNGADATNQESQTDYVTPAATPRGSFNQDQPSPSPKLFKVPSNDYRPPAPKIELYRTESAAFQDELYNPADFDQPAPTSMQQRRPQTSAHTSQHHDALRSPSRNLVNEYVKTANQARSHSPVQPAANRDRSPFRHGSSLAPNEEFHIQHRNSVPMLNTAAAVRRQRLAQNAALEVAAHQPTFNRQETKTISPKDAMLDYNDADQDNANNNNMSLFTGSLVDGYQRHFSDADALFASGYLGGVSGYVPVAHNNFGFRAADGSSVPPPRPTHTSPGATSSQRLQGQPGVQQQRRAPYTQQQQQPPSFHAGVQSQTHVSEATPEFPVNLVSMESSISDGTAVPSSQDMNPPAKRVMPSDDSSTKRRVRPRSAAGTSPTQSIVSVTDPSSPGGASPDVPASSNTMNDDPTDPVGHALPAAAISARNAQTGPHKCTRINAQTGQPCNIVFSRPYDLTRHEDTIHNRVKHKVECEWCKRTGEIKTFSRADALTRHMRVVHPEIEHHPGRKAKDY